MIDAKFVGLRTYQKNVERYVRLLRGWTAVYWEAPDRRTIGHGAAVSIAQILIEANRACNRQPSFNMAERANSDQPTSTAQLARKRGCTEIHAAMHKLRSISQSWSTRQWHRRAMRHVLGCCFQ